LRDLRAGPGVAGRLEYAANPDSGVFADFPEGVFAVWSVHAELHADPLHPAAHSPSSPVKK
jgi:hypothetical protein